MKCHSVITSPIFYVLEQSKNPSLDAFDQYYHLLMLINPKRVKNKLISQGFFLNGDPFADEAKYLPNDTKMEIILKEIRSCIALTGEEMFSDFVAVLLSDSMYADLGCKLLGKNVFANLHCGYLVHKYQKNNKRGSSTPGGTGNRKVPPGWDLQLFL